MTFDLDTDSKQRALRAFRKRHLRFVVLEAIALGLLANAPVIALRSFGSPAWQLGLGLLPSSLGILVDLWIGSRLRERHLRAYMTGAAVWFAACVGAMGLATDSLTFLLLSGFGLLGSVVVQIALTTMIRQAYPPEVRGKITGSMRRWFSLAFTLSAIVGAAALEATRGRGLELATARVLTTCAAICLAGGAVVLARMPFASRPSAGAAPARFGVSHLAGILRTDTRFRAYLGITFLASIGSLIASPYTKALLVNELGQTYLATLAVTQLLPNLVASVTTPWWGRRIDQHGAWRCWAHIRGTWSASFGILLIVAWLAATAPAVSMGLAIVAMAIFGSVMGGSWVLYWQLGVTQFAPTGPETARYMSLMAATSGLARLVGPSLGGLTLALAATTAPAFAAASAVLALSSFLCARAARRESVRPELLTATTFESGRTSPPEERQRAS